MKQIKIWRPQIPYILFYREIKRNAKGNIVRTKYLKRILSLHFIRKEGRGGNIKGFPLCYLNNMIKQMEECSLIKFLDHTKYQLLSLSKRDKKEIRKSDEWWN